MGVFGEEWKQRIAAVAAKVRSSLERIDRFWQNICGVRSNFVDCESLLQSKSPDILALSETNVDDSIKSGNFSVRG